MEDINKHNDVDLEGEILVGKKDLTKIQDQANINIEELKKRKEKRIKRFKKIFFPTTFGLVGIGAGIGVGAAIWATQPKIDTGIYDLSELTEDQCAIVGPLQEDIWVIEGTSTKDGWVKEATDKYYKRAANNFDYFRQDFLQQIVRRVNVLKTLFNFKGDLKMKIENLGVTDPVFGTLNRTFTMYILFDLNGSITYKNTLGSNIELKAKIKGSIEVDDCGWNIFDNTSGVSEGKKSNLFLNLFGLTGEGDTPSTKISSWADGTINWTIDGQEQEEIKRVDSEAIVYDLKNIGVLDIDKLQKDPVVLGALLANENLKKQGASITFTDISIIEKPE